MTRDTVWSAQALVDLENLPWRDAESVCRAIVRLVERSEGDVERLSANPADNRFVLREPGYRIVFSYDRGTRTFHVWRVLGPRA